MGFKWPVTPAVAIVIACTTINIYFSWLINVITVAILRTTRTRVQENPVYSGANVKVNIL